MARYQVSVLVEVEVPDEIAVDEDAAFESAWQHVDVIMQRAWDTDQGRHHIRPWHFEMTEDSVVALVE